MYFYDTGIATSLLSITTPEQLFTHYLRGNLFESYIVSDFIKQRFNKGLTSNCYFWRDLSGYEVDCILEYSHNLTPVEIKASQTFNYNVLASLKTWNAFSRSPEKYNTVIYGGNVESLASMDAYLIGVLLVHLIKSD